MRLNLPGIYGAARVFVLLTIASFILIIPAFYNGYPIIGGDSGAYLSNVPDLSMPIDRSVFYSVFIRATGMQFSLWSTVICQGLIVAGLLYIITAQLFKDAFNLRIYFFLVTATALFTSEGWFCGQLMADIFTAILLLVLLVHFFIPIHNKWQQALFYGALYFFIIVHNSNLITSLLIGLVVLLVARRRKDAFLRTQSLKLIAGFVLGWLTLSCCNLKAGHGFRPSASTHVFLMCRMMENGILDEYLDEHCADNNYKLCAFKGTFPNRQWEFMWDPNSALYKTGGWDSSEKEYNQIILQTLIRPNYLLLHIYKNSLASLRELPLIYVGDALGSSSTNSALPGVKSIARTEVKECSSSLQKNDNLKFDFFNVLIFIFSAVTCLGAILVMLADKGADRKKWSNWFLFVLLYLLVNAVVSVTFSTIVSRFQSRVFWVLPFFCLAYILRYFINRTSRSIV